MLLIQYQVLSAGVPVLQMETAGKVAAAERGTGVVIPLELDGVRLMLPGLDGTKVNLLLVKLGG